MPLLPLATILTILFIVPFAVSVAHAGIPVEDEDRDPTTGYSEEPGVSYSWAWMYAVWNPVPQTYSNHAFDHDANIEYIGGLYKYEEEEYAGVSYPYCWTLVWYRNNTEEDWELDTMAQVNFSPL